MHNVIRYGLFFSLIISLISFSDLSAQLTYFNIMLDGQQASAGNGTGSPGTGQGYGTYDASTMTVTLCGSYSGLMGNVSAAHSHRAPAGSNGNVAFGLSYTPMSNTGTFSGSKVLSSNDAGLLLNDGMYVNIHTTAFGGGEIRGQVLVQSVEICNNNIDDDSDGMTDEKENNIWIGGTNGDWHASQCNWSLGIIPNYCHSVIINAPDTVGVSVGNLAIGYLLDVKAGATLCGDGELDIISN